MFIPLLNEGICKRQEVVVTIGNQRYDPISITQPTTVLCTLCKVGKSDIHCALTQHVQHLREKLIHSHTRDIRVHVHTCFWMALTCTSDSCNLSRFFDAQKRKMFLIAAEISAEWKRAKPLLMHILATPWRIVCVVRVLDVAHPAPRKWMSPRTSAARPPRINPGGIIGFLKKAGNERPTGLAKGIHRAADGSEGWQSVGMGAKSRELIHVNLN